MKIDTMRVARFLVVSFLILFVGCNSSSQEQKPDQSEAVRLDAQPPGAEQADEGHSQESAPQLVAEVLPFGEINARILKMQPKPEIAALSEKMMASIAEHGSWIETHVAKHKDLKPGERLPYHKKFGISEQEYVKLSDGLKNTVLTPVADCKLVIERESDGRISFLGTGGTERLSGLKIEPETLFVEFGGIRVADYEETDSSDDALFPMTAIKWKHEDANPSASNIETLFVKIGRHKRSGHGVLLFRVLRVEDGEILAKDELNIEWDL